MILFLKENESDNEQVLLYFKESAKNLFPHWDLAKKYNLIDFELDKITGAGFPVYMGKGAILQRVLIQF